MVEGSHMVKSQEDNQQNSRISDSKIKKMNMLGQLSFGIAHDIRNSLQIIRSSSMMIRRYSNDPYLEQKVDAIDSVVENTAQMLERLLSFSNKSYNMTEELDLSISLAEIISLAELLLPPHIRIEYIRPDKPMMVIADLTEITQAILNLVKNASDAIGECGEPGMITISLNDCFPWIELKVADNGPGIEKVHLNSIFDPLFTTKDDGTGIGLANVQATIDSHGGTISVASRLGEGTEFIIMLPKKV